VQGARETTSSKLKAQRSKLKAEGSRFKAERGLKKLRSAKHSRPEARGKNRDMGVDPLKKLYYGSKGIRGHES